MMDKKMVLSLEWFRAHQIRKVRQRFVEGGGEKHRMPGSERIWNYKKKSLTERNKRERTE